MEKRAGGYEGFIANSGFQLLEDSRELPRLKGLDTQGLRA